MSDFDAGTNLHELIGNNGRVLHKLIVQIESLASETLASGQVAGLNEADISALLTQAVKLYAALSDQPGTGPPSSHLAVNPTEAVVAAAALLRSQRLTPFEFAIWFDGGEPSAFTQ